MQRSSIIAVIRDSVSSIAVASDFAEQLQQVAEFADTVPEDSMDRSEALRRSVFSFANITSSL
jgi:hypothetical protein